MQTHEQHAISPPTHTLKLATHDINNTRPIIRLDICETRK